MFSYTVNEKTGFKTEFSPVEIFDRRGKLFYFHRGNPNGVFYFNLPRGQFFTENPIIKTGRPINSTLPKLPKREKPYKIPGRIKIEHLDNPNKASIWIHKKKIIIDPNIFKMSIPAICFILFHEIGHYLYKSEEKCDIFAIREMLKQGFNPSQCGLAVVEALGDYSTSKNRKICILQQVKNIQNGTF